MENKKIFECPELTIVYFEGDLATDDIIDESNNDIGGIGFEDLP